jgi:hypothetical protein
MNIAKNELANKLGEQFIYDCLIYFVNKDMQTTIIRDAIIDHLKESEKPREKIVKCV